MYSSIISHCKFIIMRSVIMTFAVSMTAFYSAPSLGPSATTGGQVQAVRKGGIGQKTFYFNKIIIRISGSLGKLFVLFIL